MWNNTYIDGDVAYNMTGLTSQGNNTQGTFTVSATTLNMYRGITDHVKATAAVLSRGFRAKHQA